MILKLPRVSQRSLPGKPAQWVNFTRPSTPHEQSGQSIAEVAMLTPLVLLLLLGTIEIGRFAYYGIEVANAARAGVQYGAQSLADSKDASGIQLAAQNDAQNIPGLGVTSTNHCACSDDPSDYLGCPVNPRNCASGHPLVFLEVNTTGTFQSIFHYPGLPPSLTIHGQAIMRVAPQ